MFKIDWVRYAALLWGLAVFMPVGANYLGFFMLVACMLLQHGLRERLARLRHHAIWWPAVAFVIWTLVVLVLMPTYPETPSNLLHAFRIVATVALALALTREEAVWALRGFVIAGAVSLLLVGASQLVAFPEAAIWSSLLHHSGNKSISNAVLFALLASSLVVIALDRGGWIRASSLPLAIALLSVAVWVLPSRTSVLIFLFVLGAACVHQWRSHWLALVVALVVATLGAGAVVTGVPKVQQRLAQGITEIQSARAGKVSQESWGVRVNMYRHTLDMLAERPLTGWGIGAWTQQWKQRVPPVLREFNMPHNDFLWMGAQAGVLGASTLLILVLTGVRISWKRRDLTGRLGMVAMLTLLLAASINSAMRDAAIGLSLIWVAGLYLRMVSEPQDAVALLHRPAPGEHHANGFQQDHPVHPQ